MVADKNDAAQTPLRLMSEQIAALIRIADEHQEHVVAAMLCDAHAHLRRKLDDAPPQA